MKALIIYAVTLEMMFLLSRRNKSLHGAGKTRSCCVRPPTHTHLTKRVLQISFTALSVFQIACASFIETNRDKYVRKVTRRNKQCGHFSKSTTMIILFSDYKPKQKNSLVRNRNGCSHTHPKPFKLLKILYLTRETKKNNQQY